MKVSLVALVCRTADRTPGGVRGAQTLAPLIGKRLGVEPRTIEENGYEQDLRDSRGCLLEAGGQIDDALSGGRVPVIAAADCSIAVTTLPAVLRHRPDARVLWLDAHGDYNTPETSGSGYLGGMCLAGACGEWDAGLGETIAADRLVLAGVRDLDAGERELLERSDATVIGASVVETLVAVKNALDGAPVFIHLDLDVLDPEEFPAAVPAPGGLSSDKLYDLMEAVADDSELVGIEVTAFEAPGDPDELADAAETAMRVLDPVLDRIAADAQE
jgi:arginase